jgi:hypothetical protein
MYKKKKFDPFAPKKTKKQKVVTIHDLTGGTTYEEMFGSNTPF